MSLTSDSYGSVATCRLYVDYIQYIKLIGYIDSYELIGLDGDSKSVWDYDPSNMQLYTANDNVQGLQWKMKFKNGNQKFSQFLSTVNYFGALGHDFGNTSASIFAIRTGTDTTAAYVDNGDEIVGSVDSLGYTLREIVGGSGNLDISGLDEIDWLKIYIYDPTYFSAGDEVNVGSIVCGRYFDFPHRTEISTSINKSYEGIKTKKTVSGRSISNTYYYKQPDWGDYPAWTSIDTDSLADGVTDVSLQFKQVAQGGRRSWDLKWSYLSKEDVFPETTEGSMIGAYSNDETTFDVKDNIMGSLMSFSLGGQIPMLFQPDKTKQEFAKVRVNQKSISIQQSAPNLYTCKLKLEEVW